jgi:hypothetical protein
VFLHIHQYGLYDDYKLYFVFLFIATLEEIPYEGQIAEKRHLVIDLFLILGYETANGDNITIPYLDRGAEFPQVDGG